MGTNVKITARMSSETYRKYATETIFYPNKNFGSQFLSSERKKKGRKSGVSKSVETKHLSYLTISEIRLRPAFA